MAGSLATLSSVTITPVYPKEHVCSEVVLYVPRSLDLGTREEEQVLREDGYSGTEGREIVVSKMQSLRWLENLKQSQRLTAREERRKEEILEVFRELYDISAHHPDPPVFPPWRPSW